MNALPANLTFEYAQLILIACGAFVLLFLAALLFFVLGRQFGKFESDRKFKILLNEGRKDAVKRSRAVIGGQLGEQFAPFFPDFPAPAADARFLGKPVDFICFCGLSDSDEVSEIVFVEVKTGSSALSGREKQIKKAVEEKRVRYAEYRLPGGS